MGPCMCAEEEDEDDEEIGGEERDKEEIPVGEVAPCCARTRPYSVSNSCTRSANFCTSSSSVPT